MFFLRFAYLFATSSAKASCMTDEIEIIPIAGRFRGFLPVVVDVETGGFDCRRDALLELAAVILRIDEKGSCHVIEPLIGI